MNIGEFKSKLKSYTIDFDSFLIGKGNECEPNFNIGGRSKLELKHAHYAVKLFEDKEVFIVWDLQRHRDKNSGMSMLGLTENNWNDIDCGKDTFEPCYKELANRCSGIYEKIYIVGTSHFEKFFKNYASYMKLNKEDDEYPVNANANDEEAQWSNNNERRKYSSSQYKRDKNFREKVLEAYEYQCAICRCGISEVLQAAHEHGYEVRSTSYDDPKHGICLCANHHLMYDNDVIDIDLNTHTIKILKNKNEIKEAVWYKEFSEKYHLKIKEKKQNVKICN